MTISNPSEPDLTDVPALIAAGVLEQTIAGLIKAAAKDQTGESNGALGVIYFQQQDYVAALDQFETALKQQPTRGEWLELRDLCRFNAEAEVNVQVPDHQHYERDELLRPPVVPAGTLPSPPPHLERSLGERLRVIGGNVIGAAVSVTFDGITNGLGLAIGYRDDVWTNWYRRNTALGILTLAYMRNQLNKHNLLSTYPPGRLIGWQNAGLTPPAGVTHFRTADGSWNNLSNPKEGAAGTRFPRNVRNWSIRPETGAQLMNPNPRLVSRKLLRRSELVKEVPFLNLLAACWINFENHDWISHGENLHLELHEIPLDADDPARLKFRQKYLYVGKTQPDPTRMEASEITSTTFINEVTHWWDGSQIYGSDQVTVDHLRSHVDGKIALTAQQTLPLDANGVEETGFKRDWWVGLAMLHTLFAREHNAICEMLKSHHPEWDDNRLFNVARLIDAAVMAKIHSVEWTPAILPNQVLSDGLNANWYGLLTNLFRHGKGKKTVAAINIRNPELGGVVGNPINKHGVAYGLTEEFVEVYRLHSLLPEKLVMHHLGGSEVVEEVPFLASRQAGSPKVTTRIGLTDLFYSFGNQHPGQLVLHNYPRFMLELSVPGNPVFDMGAVDVLRARERGVPRYNEFRRQLGLNPLRTMSDLTSDPDDLRLLAEVYGDGPNAVEQLDLLVGTLGEQRRPTGFGFGETLFQIFILNATRRLQADRFYTDNYNEETYTKEGLEWVDAASLKSVILRHYPELAQTGLANIKNAFEPWDTDDTLDPARHPLRGYDRELRSDPWTGEVAKQRRQLH